jgi:nucleoside-diphosphate-sugar epimerase
MNSILCNDAFDVIGSCDTFLFKDKKILITGASGLLGIHFISMLKVLTFDFECILIINSEPEKYFIEQIIGDTRFKYYQFNLSTNEFYNEFEDATFDVIMHLATYGQPLKFIKNELSTITMNTTLTMQLFNLLEPKGRFLYFSSSELYSGLSSSFHNETEIGTTTPEHFRSCYIEGKRCGEAICNVYYKMGYDVKIIRLSLAYGSGVKLSDTRALNNFVFSALASGRIELRDSGQAIRSYLYVSDALKMILDVMNSGKHLIYNIGGNQAITIKQLAETIGEQLCVPVHVPKLNEELEGAPSQVILSLERYLSEFTIDKFIDIHEGIERTIEWWKYLIKNK